MRDGPLRNAFYAPNAAHSGRDYSTPFESSDNSRKHPVTPVHTTITPSSLPNSQA